MDNVLLYELLLEKIFSYLSLEAIHSCREVCTKWRKVADLVDTRRRRIYQVCYPFRLPRFEDGSLPSRSLSCTKQLPWLCDTTLPCGTENLEVKLNKDIKDLYSSPYLMILVEGNNTKVGKKRKWKRAKVINAVRAQLHPRCRVIGIDAHYGVIGQTPPDLLALDFNHTGIFCISSHLLPQFAGVDIEVFHRLTELNVTPDVKGVVLFSSGVSFHGEYLEHPNVLQMVEELDGNLALGGAQVNDKLVTKLYQTRYSDDTANYLFVNGVPPYNPMFNPQKMSLIGIKFSGPNVSAASVVIEPLPSSVDGDVSAELAFIEDQLLTFKDRLSFDPNSTLSNECLGFLFFNYTRYCTYASGTGNANAGVDIFNKVFPKTMILGLLTHAQYELNHWPQIEPSLTKMRVSEDGKPILFPTTSSVASFVIFSIRKASHYRHDETV